LEALRLNNFYGSVTEYARRCKTDIARVKGNDFDYNANNRLTEAIFDTLLGGTGHTIFTNKLSSAYNNFTSLSLFQQKAYDVHTLLDMAIDTHTPLYRTKKWNWSPNARTNHDDMQMITALTSEIWTLQNDLQKLRKNQHFESDTKNEQKERKVYPPTTAKKYRKNNIPKEGDPQTFKKSDGKIIKWCRQHGWNNTHLTSECNKLNNDSNKQIRPIAGLSSLIKDE